MPDGGPNRADPRKTVVVAPNFKRRLSGVTSTIIQLVPLQAKAIGIAATGPGLPRSLPHLGWWQFAAFWRKPAGRSFRVWHARRNVEMLAGVIMRDVLRMKVKLVFTSASQREHKAWTRFLIDRMDRVVATSRKTAAYLKVPNTVIMHGIDTERFSPPPDRRVAIAALGLDPEQKYVGCFGRVRAQKGTDLFVDAMIRLLPDHPGWSAIVAGRATQSHLAFEEGLKKRAAEAGLAERILFVGEHKDIPRWYRALSLFVAPQRWEGFGLTPLEAMATAVPVVAADVGAFSELIVAGTGEIVPPDDLDAMTRAIGAYLSSPARIADEAPRARSHVEADFPLERESRQLVALYEELSVRS